MIDNPSAASSPSFPAHLRSPSLALLFLLMAVMLLFSGVATVINTIKNLAESVRGRGRDAAIQHFTTPFMHVDSFLGAGIMGLFGVWLRVFPAPGCGC